MAMFDYLFYKDVFGGNIISEKQFNSVAIRANSVLQGIEEQADISYYDAENGRDFTLCVLCEEVYKTMQAELPQEVGGIAINGAISSISLGVLSASFVAQSPQEVAENAEKRYYKAVKQFAHIYHGKRWFI